MYEYTDDDNDSLHVESSIVFCHTYVGTVQDNGPATGVLIHNEDAPAIALAILEAAGMGPDSTEPTVREAARDLAVYVKSRAKRAEREAEDAKVRNFRAHQWKAQDENRSEVMPLWDDIDDYGRDLWRTEYRAARKFFEEA